ncbi:MAG: hypothetical protein B7Y99_00340 [Caulobacterales bacterium 32-69-10]|nr:MAG: hypothetical protein B7Y99_00340 [Caulobacterales bacterium 32-69-10]
MAGALLLRFAQSPEHAYSAPMNHPIPPEADYDDVATEAAPQLWRRWLKFLPILVIAMGLVLIVSTGLYRYLSIEMLEAKRQDLQAAVVAHPARSVLIYMVAYMVMVAFSVPGAMIMTMAGGFLFGPWLGSASAVAGMTAGALIMFWVARSALGEIIRKRAKTGGLIEKIQLGVKANAFTYLLVLRLIPAVPFWLCNIAAGFVPMPVRTYLAATVLGIIPSTVIYSSIGSGLGHVFDKGEKPNLGLLTDPQVFVPLIGLCLLSVIPLVLHALKARRRPAVIEAP